MDINDILFHLGEPHNDWYNSIAPPIYQTSNFKLNSVEDFTQKIRHEFDNYLYTRGNNPTVHILRKKLAALEGTEEALIFSSGSAAMAMAILSQVKANGHIICIQNPYTWTKKFINGWLARMGITCTYVNGSNPASIAAAIQDNTTTIILESPNSITFEIQDLAAISAIAKAGKLTTIIDNSYSTPLYQKPVEFGIDIIVHSATKYLNGHSDVVAGAICSSEKIIRKMFSEEYMMLGAIISPYEAAQIIRGLRTLSVRIEKNTESALFIAKELEKHPKVKQVLHPHLDSFSQVDLARKQMKHCGGLFSIVLNTNDPDACKRFANHLKCFAMAASWGGFESLVLPMVAFKDYMGADPNGPPWQLLRLYVGLEDREYLLKDLLRALETM
jgi:cystathionine beta-lyase